MIQPFCPRGRFTQRRDKYQTENPLSVFCLNQKFMEKYQHFKIYKHFFAYHKLQLSLTETYSEECKNVGTGCNTHAHY